jgi:CxxC motif-containing protein (DUF1111 family)
LSPLVLSGQTIKPIEIVPGFSTPLLHESHGAGNSSNGIIEPPRDTFLSDEIRFEGSHNEANGLGPTYNAKSCAECHQDPVSGGSGKITVLRAGHRNRLGRFINPSIVMGNGKTLITGRSIVDKYATCQWAQEHLSKQETIRSIRVTPSALGDGYVEAVADSELIKLSREEAQLSHGEVLGEYVMVPVLEAPGFSRVGRFGWKDQQASLLSFAAEAYLEEIGITNRLEPKDLTLVCKTTSDPEDHPDVAGMDDIDHFAQFIRGTKAPPRDSALSKLNDAHDGEALFKNVGCDLCHTSTMVTSAPGTILNGGKYVVPDAIGNKEFHPFSDFLLHDIGTGDGIVQNGPQDTANKIRTAALWGLRARNLYMHDGKSKTIEDAINRHAGESTEITGRYHQLSRQEREKLLTFVRSL